jgi:hypothetical protein
MVVAVTSSIGLAMLGYLFCYFILYRKNKFIGNIGYVSVSVAFLGMTATTNGPLIDSENAIGLLLVVGSIISLIWDAITTIRPKGKRG